MQYLGGPYITWGNSIVFSRHKMQLQATETCGPDKMLGSVQLRVQVIILRVVSKGCIATAWCDASVAS
jgi:hypothetical protein